MNGTTLRDRMIAAAMMLAVMALAVTGCTAKVKTSTVVEKKPGNATQASSMSGGMEVDPNSQNCAACTKGEVAQPVAGTVELVDGKQMINVTIKDGTYVSNRFTAQAGSPVVVTFTVEGKPAIKCLSKPTFKQLDKTVAITSGTKSIDLGTLAAGTYEFTCAMGRPVGQIVVQ